MMPVTAAGFHQYAPTFALQASCDGLQYLYTVAVIKK